MDRPAERGGQAPEVHPASLLVTDPHRQRRRVSIEPVPFRIGRQAESDLIIRDSRASRTHARIVVEDGEYVLEDCGSRHGTFVNGRKISRHALQNSDRIEFGVADSYQLTFALDGAELKRLMDQVSTTDASSTAPGLGGNLAKLRAILDLARTLESAFSIDDVLVSVVDTALAITGSERGFLLLREGDGLDTRVARHRSGHKLPESDLRVPRQVIHRALENRRELFSMNFDPHRAGQDSVADLELRSVICLPLVRIRTALADATSVVSPARETLGVLYMDSRIAAADLAGGNRELLQTLAMEASTVLENARLLEEERAKQKLEEELRLARTIQQSLLPGKLPCDGWVRACGSSVASHQVGGDYFDARPVHAGCWSAVVADVSGKGVGSALLASLLQGALIAATDRPEVLGRRIEGLSHFLLDRTSGEKYATVFYCLLERGGRFSYVNAAHCPPLLLRAGGGREALEATGMPVGLIPEAQFELAERQLAPGDKIVIYTDGVTEAQNTAAEFFGRKRLEAIAAAHAADSSAALHDAIQEAVAAFTEGAPQSDDITLLVLEYAGGPK